MKLSKPALATLLLVAATAVWGSTFVVVKDAVSRMPVMDFLAWRFTIAAIAIATARPRALSRLDRRGKILGVVLGLALGTGYITQTVGLERTSATVSGFLTGLLVVFTPLCAAIALRRPPGALTWVGVALATAGLGVISLHGFSIGYGEAITLLCALLFALHILGLGEWSPSYDAAGLAVMQLSTVAVLSIVCAAPDSLAPPPDAKAWEAVVFTALFATAVAFFIQTWSQAQLAPTRAAVVLTMEPVFAGIFGVTVGGDRLGPRIVIGGVLVLAAMYTVELGPRKSRDALVQRFE
ncbi:MAG TPA: DMT family transporter [Mycobacteriales bacterium]|nr:DMT family transporter [Mycobacteriales bacterium]